MKMDVYTIGPAIERGIDSYCRVKQMMSAQTVDRYAYTMKMKNVTSRLETILQGITAEVGRLSFVFSDGEAEAVISNGKIRFSVIIEMDHINCVNCIFNDAEGKLYGQYFEGEANEPVIEWITGAIAVVK